jgi:hypothetical protein
MKKLLLFLFCIAAGVRLGAGTVNLTVTGGVPTGGGNATNVNLGPGVFMLVHTNAPGSWNINADTNGILSWLDEIFSPIGSGGSGTATNLTGAATNQVLALIGSSTIPATNITGTLTNNTTGSAATANSATNAQNGLLGGDIVTNVIFSNVVQAYGSGSTIYLAKSDVPAENNSWRIVNTNSGGNVVVYSAGFTNLFLLFNTSYNYWLFGTDTNGNNATETTSGRNPWNNWYHSDGSVSPIVGSVGSLHTNTFYWNPAGSTPTVSYVDQSSLTNGNNYIASRGGFPFADFDHAAANAQSGDTIVLLPGTPTITNTECTIPPYVTVVGQGVATMLQYRWDTGSGETINPGIGDVFENVAFTNTVFGGYITNLTLSTVWLFNQNVVDVFYSESSGPYDSSFTDLHAWGAYDLLLNCHNVKIVNSELYGGGVTPYPGRVLQGDSFIVVNTILSYTNNSGGVGIFSELAFNGTTNTSAFENCVFIHGTNIPAIMGTTNVVLANCIDNGSMLVRVLNGSSLNVTNLYHHPTNGFDFITTTP